jgi:ubiquinone biosynthesis monooxygenase Coq7
MSNNFLRLPGDHNLKDKIAEIIRVNHAGEYGAKRIYEGQLAVLKNSSSGKVIAKMKEQEQEHLEYFEREMMNRKVRPSVLFPFWHVAGFALGAVTALLGSKAAMACTVAVEEVIDEHYQQQLNELQDKDIDLSNEIAKFKQDEQHHKAEALAHHAEQTPLYLAFTSIIKLGCRLSIQLAKKF